MKPDANTIVCVLLLILLITILIFFSSSPFVLRLSLVSLVIILGVGLALVNLTWLFYAIVVVFLGGIIVAFTYCSSLNSYFKFYVNINFLFLFTLLFITGGILIPNSSLLINIKFIIRFLVFQSIPLFLFTFSILLTLTLVVKIVSINEGPLKL